MSAFDPFLPLAPRVSTGIGVPIEAPDVEVVGVEKPRALKREHIRDGQPLPFENNQALSSEFLDRPVDVNRRQTGRVGDVILGEREIAREAIGQAD